MQLVVAPVAAGQQCASREGGDVLVQPAGLAGALVQNVVLAWRGVIGPVRRLVGLLIAHHPLEPVDGARGLMRSLQFAFVGVLARCRVYLHAATVAVIVPHCHGCPSATVGLAPAAAIGGGRSRGTVQAYRVLLFIVPRIPTIRTAIALHGDTG